MEHLLARLELDDAPVCKRIVDLTFNSYIPADKSPEVYSYINCLCFTYTVFILVNLHFNLGQ